MSTNNFRQDLETYEQLRLAIGDDDLVDEGAVTPADARSRSEAARMTLEHLTLPFPEGKGEKTPPSNLPPNSANLEGDIGVTWLEEFHQLVDQGWKWRIAAYIAWASSPKVNRWPATQQLLATQVLGLNSDRTIIAARKKNTAIDQTVAVMQAAPLMAHRRDIIDAMIKSALILGRNGNPDRKMSMEMTGDYQRKVTIEEGTSQADKTENMSAEELMQRSAVLQKRRDELLGKAAAEDIADGE